MGLCGTVKADLITHFFHDWVIAGVVTLAPLSDFKNDACDNRPN